MRGVVGVFRELDATLEAIDVLKREKFAITAYTPTPRHEFEDALNRGPSVVRRFTLIGGMCGVTFGYWIAIWISDYWPIVVGGKAIASWIPYTIIAFEVMVLVGALATVFGMFYAARIPKLAMTIGYDPRFSGGNYGVWVECAPDRAKAAADLLRRSGALEVRDEQ